MNKHVYTSAEQRQVWRVVPELIKARELLVALVWKDLRVRYRYAALGFLWAIVEPLALMLALTFVFTFAFQDSAPFPNDGSGPHFAVNLLCGLIFWQFFATAINRATSSLLENQNLVKKIYFAREIIPLASLGYPLFNLMIGMVLLVILHLSWGGHLGMGLVWFPLILGIQITLTAGMALLLSCLNVRFRDVGYMVGVAVVLGFYASPVFYPIESIMESNMLPKWGQYLYLLNPMTELLTAYRQIFFESHFPDMWLLVWPTLSAALSLALGVYVFRKTAPTLSDYL